jgi:hypothetical protein
MGPLVYYSRWRGVKLRLHGRNQQFVWGHLVAQDEGAERPESFRFNLRTWQLELGDGDELKRLQLDELGVVVEPNEPPSPMTNAGASPQ